MNTVACVLRTGGVYDMVWVRRLHDAVTRFHAQLNFVCLTDARAEALPFETIPLRLRLPGWWSKIELFQENLFARDERVLYLDLDTVIAGPLSPFLDYPGLAILRDFNLTEHREVHGLPAIGSAVVLWRDNALTSVFDAFAADPGGVISDHPKRMDHFIRKHLPACDYVQDLWPGMVACAKKGFRGWLPGPPRGARIICTWGKPRISELPADHWYRRMWEEECISC